MSNDTNCRVITDDLLILNNAPTDFLKNIVEIQGFLKIHNTAVTHFDALPNLEKLNICNSTHLFKELLKKRFPKKNQADILYAHFLRFFEEMPSNCGVLRTAYASPFGLSETDMFTNTNFIEETRRQTGPDSINWIKMWSLPNYTVKDFYDNVETGGGYYYGEELLTRIRLNTDMYIFFTTLPMACGVGAFGECDRSWLYAISSVPKLRGYGGQTTQLAVVAELDGKNDTLTFNVVLKGDQKISYDEHSMVFSTGGQKGKPEKKTSNSAPDTATPKASENKAANSVPETATSKESQAKAPDNITSKK